MLHFCLWIEDIVHSNELKSPRFIRYNTTFFLSISSFFLDWNNTTPSFHCQLLSFHVGFVFLDAGRFYNILSCFSIVLPVVETEVSWIIDIIGQYACLSMIGEEYHLFWKILWHLSSFLVFSFSNLA